ncbi:hypothetical protein [Lysobacter enzymogenes]|uniref:hypothetical protein n=1 Tax=Lysobacter enzymogenes TaxID=69 RepID=UPI001A97A61B|nr:hypothetical protein [Lysobacter enzymogenes]QQP97764.1 hypothetical protein JHW38_07065 [Lysobacter enzymogenes]
MPINYIPNDPRAKKFNRSRKQTAIKNRPAKDAQLTFRALPGQKPYAEGGLDWLAWQVRESSLRALAAFEKIDGPLARWPRTAAAKSLPVTLVRGQEANAYYSGGELVFCRVRRGNKDHYTGASADVVAHEVGHALLDALRPELWDIQFIEVAAFHESFGDCIALLSALADKDIRNDIVAGNGLNRRNHLETWGEQLAWLAGPDNVPRQMLNDLQWHFPSKDDEIHDFGQIFTGCFYDLIRFRLAAAKTRSEKTLWNAAQSAARLLFAAARKAPVTPRFFQALGRVMEIESVRDRALHAAVRQAFGRHGIALGSAAILSPKATLAGKAGSARAQWRPSDDGLDDLRNRTGAGDAVPLCLRPLQLGGHELVEATYPRAIDIGRRLSGALKGGALKGAALKGVQAFAAEGVLLGRMKPATSAARTSSVAILTALPDAVATENEVMEFVAGLVERKQVAAKVPAPRAAGAQRRTKAAMAAASAASVGDEPPGTTHRVVDTEDGRRVLKRLRFACACRERR